jgi:hypothetical protein
LLWRDGVQSVFEEELVEFCNQQTVDRIIRKAGTDERYLQLYSDLYAAETVGRVIQLLKDLDIPMKPAVLPTNDGMEREMIAVYSNVCIFGNFLIINQL